jgi:hypothetical protein
VAIDEVEWFASAADLCRVMRWFDKRADSTALAILAVNPGLKIPADKFPYVGFKGGSETGVLNLTWLLRTKEGRSYALAATWNNPEQAVELEKFSGLLLAAAELLDVAK